MPQKGRSLNNDKKGAQVMKLLQTKVSRRLLVASSATAALAHFRARCLYRV